VEVRAATAATRPQAAGQTGGPHICEPNRVPSLICLDLRAVVLPHAHHANGQVVQNPAKAGAGQAQATHLPCRQHVATKNSRVLSPPVIAVCVLQAHSAILTC
jgi:hypothetical protein